MVTEGLQAAQGEELEQFLREARPKAPGSELLEKRLAVASILAAAGSDAERPRLGRLEVQSRIGGGAMGVVYRAFDPELQRLVAVKLLRSWTEPAERLRIVEEARRLAQLSHPNIVAVHDIVNGDDGLYFTMEYVAGVTLGDWLLARPEASFREVLQWFVEAGRGLCAAHSAGMVHRDFKPDNVLVGEDGRVRVVDFGLARVLREGSEHDAAGTPYYMSPEVLDGQAATAASDQFAFCRALADALERRQVPPQVLGAVERGLAPRPEGRHRELCALVDLLEGALREGNHHHPRGLLLDRVERLWLRGVLERSLGEGGAAELSLRSRPELVEPPWEVNDVSSSTPAPRISQPGQAGAAEIGQLLIESHGSLLLVGPPGAGKSTLLMQLCRELWRGASLNPEAPTPAILSLSTYCPEARRGDAERSAAHFAAWVIDELVVKYGLPRPIVQRWLDESGIALLLDGLDETQPGQQARIVDSLNDFRRRYPLPMVVTCRDSEYVVLDSLLAFGAAYEVQPLDDRAMLRLLEERRAGQLLEQLPADSELRAQLRNPLLLTLYAGSTDGDDGDTEGGDDGSAPVGAQQVLSRAYERYVERAWSRSDATERRTLQAQLGWLARAMRRQNTSDLWLERLHFGWLPHRWGRGVAYLSGVLLVCLFAVGLNLAQVPLTGYPLGSALVFGLGVFLSSFAYTRGRITPVESLRWSSRRALRLLPLTLGCATIIGLIEALKVNFISNMVGAALTGIIFAVLFALEPGERAARVSPNAGIHQSLENALRLSFGVGVPVGVAFYAVFQPYLLHPLADVSEYSGNPRLIVGVAIGLFVFTAVFLIYGGFTALMHYTLRLWLALRTPLPLRLVPVLDRAAELGLMRRVGGGYVFLHRTLLDHFADGPTERR